MAQSKQPRNIGRNIGVRILIEKAIQVLEMVSDELELWCVADLAPEIRDAFPPTEHKLLNVGLGPLTRNTRLDLRPDCLYVSFDGVSQHMLPYDAIYCIATSGTFAQDLNWFREGNVAYVNLVEPIHGIPKRAK